MELLEVNKTRVIADSMDNSYITADYPYGFKLRTQRKTWIETNGKRGDRVCHQTFNPKKNIWNKPKKSTYSTAIVLYINDKGYIDTYYADNQDSKHLQEFINTFELNTQQVKNINGYLALNKVLENVTWTVEPTAKTQAERDKHKQEQNEITSKIVNAWNYEAHKLNKGAL